MAGLVICFSLLACQGIFHTLRHVGDSESIKTSIPAHLNAENEILELFYKNIGLAILNLRLQQSYALSIVSLLSLSATATWNITIPVWEHCYTAREFTNRVSSSSILTQLIVTSNIIKLQPLL